MKLPPVHVVLVALIALVALAATGAPAGGQTRDDVAIALARTDHLIATGQEIVSGGGDRAAIDELASAMRLEADAKARFAAGRYALAFDLTRRARLHADRAIALARGLPDPDRVLVQLGRTRELIEHARERIRQCAVEQARAPLRGASEMQRRAETSAQEGRYLAALQFTLSARDRAHRALRMCDLEDHLPEAAERALSRTDDLISQAREAIREPEVPRARHALDRAIELQAEAWVRFKGGQFESSLHLTQSARTFAHRALRIAGPR